MPTIGKVTELDFVKIKENIKAYFKRTGSPFRDWDFDGSGLSYLLDILAYNTHYNAVNAHLSMNESFLDSAQLRSNVVSRAKLIGYTPRSKRGARAKVDLILSRKAGEEGRDSLTLPRGTTFTSSLRGKNYKFVTVEDRFAVYNADDHDEGFVFRNLQIVQGTPVIQRYVVDGAQENQRFLIDDPNIDTYTLQVRVFGHGQTSDSVVFLNANTFASVRPDSRVYFLSENFEGKYQIEFGDGIIGARLDNLNVVEVSFLSSGGAEANGAKSIKYLTSPSDVVNTATSVNRVDLVEAAYGGDDRESTESIRQVAPYSYIAQNRTVTEKDFEALIRRNIPDIEAISVWGGQNHVPPQFGKIFISAKPKSGFFLSNAQKREILRYLDTVKIVTTRPEILDPDYVYLFFDVFFNYDSNLTSLTKSQLEYEVRNNLEQFNENVVRGFEKVFRYSQFLSTIDNSDEAIISSNARIFVYKKLPLFARRRLPYTLNFNMALHGKLHQKESILSSSTWLFNNNQIELADEPITTSDSLRNIYAFYRVQNGIVVVNPSLGTLNLEKGYISLHTIPTSLDTEISIHAIPNTYDVSTLRNQLIDIDFSKTTIIGRSNIEASGTQPISRFR